MAATAAAGPPPGDLPSSPATDADETFFADQWSIRQIDADDAHAVTGGSPLVRVAVIDSGIDHTHPEFAGRIDFARSVSCVGGTPNQDPNAWLDDNGHGTHIAGVLAAGDNGFGTIGVAPHVTLVAVKVANLGGPITPEAAACAFEWVATHDIDVANASLTIDRGATPAEDPLDFYCRDVKEDRESIKLVRTAVHEARSAGVTIVAAAGNQNLDLAQPPTGNECIRMPVELPGVIGVSADNAQLLKASYSNFGVSAIDVTAPGGDLPPPAGFVLSTWPSYRQVPNLKQDPAAPAPAFYRFMAGTSVATAHVSGVAALVVSRFGDDDTPHNGKLRPGQVEAILQQTADRLSCPSEPTLCQGGEGFNGFFGHGQVNALRAVTHDPAP